MRDPIILLVHLIATLARLMGPGGLRSVVAESVLVKQQLLILNRSRHRAPNLCASDRNPRRRVCTVHAPGPGDSLSDRAETVDDPGVPSGSAHPQVPLAVFTQAPSHRPPRTVQSTGRCHRRHEAAQPQVGLSADRPTDRARLCGRHRQGRGAPSARYALSTGTPLGWSVLADVPGACEG